MSEMCSRNSTGTNTVVGTDTTTGYHGQLGLFTTENVTSLAMWSVTSLPMRNTITPSTTHLNTLPGGDFIIMVVVSMGEEEIVGPDGRRQTAAVHQPTAQPHMATTAAELANSC